MQADFNLHVQKDSWLHRLDPRVKLLFVVEATLVTFLWPTIWTAMGIIILCTVLQWRAQVPVPQAVRVWRTMAPLMIMVFVLTALFGGGPTPVLFRVGPLAVTIGAVQRGALLATRLLALASIFFLWLYTTDQAALVRGFVALRVPYEWGLTLALALRYLPIFAGLFEQVREAQQARGLDLERRSFGQRLRAYRPVLVAMMISALRNSERLGWALEARALGAVGVRRSVFRPVRLRRGDYVALGVLLLALIAAIILRIL